MSRISQAIRQPPHFFLERCDALAPTLIRMPAGGCGLAGVRCCPVHARAVRYGSTDDDGESDGTLPESEDDSDDELM